MDTKYPIVHRSLSTTYRPAEFFVRSVTVRGHMTLEAPYQRGPVWTVEQQRGLIRSWLMGLPIPAIIMNDRTTRGWETSTPEDRHTRRHAYAIIDGKQRVLAAIAWFTGDLLVPAHWFPTDHVVNPVDTPDGRMVSFLGLSETGQRFVENYAAFACAEAHVFTVAAEAEIYLLVNGVGTPQTENDLANAAKVAAAAQPGAVRYVASSIIAPLEPGEYRQLSDGRIRICCDPCGEVFTIGAASFDAALSKKADPIPFHLCGRPARREG